MLTKKIEKFDAMIADARRAKEHIKVLVYQDIKNEFLKYKTSSEFIKDVSMLKGKSDSEIDAFFDAKEISILRAMIKRRRESADIYLKAGRPENAASEKAEIEVISVLLPKASSEDDIKDVLAHYIDSLGRELSKKDMGLAIKAIKEKLPTAEGKLVAEIVKDAIR